MKFLNPNKIKNISKRDLIFTILIVLGAYTIIQQFAGLNWSEIWDSIRTANPMQALLAFIIAQLILIPNATSMMSAVTTRIPFKPTLILQSAIQFIGLAVPSTAGRVATNISYLKKFDINYVTAITQGALDSFTGFIVQVVILVCAVIFGGASFNVEQNINLNWVAILLIFGLLIPIGLIVILRNKSLRSKIIDMLGGVLSSLSGLTKEPLRLVALFGSNFLSQLVLALCLVATARAFGVSISVATSIIIVVSATLLGGVTPVPGGVGVQEAIISAGLISAGVNQNTAFGITVLYRAFTFFLPPIWGFVSFRWLAKNKFV